MVDVSTQIEIARPRADVAAYASDPDNATAWYVKTQGPFPMETTYTWGDTPSGGTRMTLRNRGEPAGFSKLVAPVMATAMRRANAKDLQQLKKILEAGSLVS